jgi:hypothetical protein
MITKKQWAHFCWNVQIAKSYFGEIFLFSRRVLKIDCYNNVIRTGKAGTPIQRFTYEESLKETTSLEDLYKSISINTNLHTIKYFKHIEF